MILNPVYKNYAKQIGELFCDEGDVLCVENVKSRIIVNLTNGIFQNYFLPQLDKSRFYAYTSRDMHHLWHTGYEFTAKGFDIVTNRAVTHEFHRVPPNILNNAEALYNSVPHYNYLGKVNGNIIVERLRGTPYGFFFIPSSIPGGGGGYQGGGGGGGNGGTITKKPPVINFPPLPVKEPVEAGFDLAGIIDNPIILIGGAALLFFYVMKN